jgi:predicted RNA-binding Zn-ribbon protein involved in translation (DUF1610 family)
MPDLDDVPPPLIRYMLCDCGNLIASVEGEFVCPNCGLAY